MHICIVSYIAKSIITSIICATLNGFTNSIKIYISVVTFFAILNELSFLQAKYRVCPEFPATQPEHPLLHKIKKRIFSLSEAVYLSQSGVIACQLSW